VLSKQKIWTAALIAGIGALCLGLLWLDAQWPALVTSGGAPPELSLQQAEGHAAVGSPLLQLFKLVVAAIIGLLVTAVHRRYPSDKPLTRSLAQAQILLCVAGSLMMIIIGGSLAIAFGVVGAASIIRFRTPVEDPKDTTILFLLLGLGMACGIGTFAVAGLGTMFLCLVLALLGSMAERKPRLLTLEMVSEGAEFPTDYVHRLLSAYQIEFEPREVEKQENQSTVKYEVTLLDPDTPLRKLSDQLMDEKAAALKAVTWKIPKNVSKG
jgi:uncharacterized membrane protein YhiD involved in acid resistance